MTLNRFIVRPETFGYTLYDRVTLRHRFFMKEQYSELIQTIEDPGELADIIVAQLNLKLEDKQKILELSNPAERLEKLLGLMTGEIEILEVEKKIRTRVKKQMERSQKEYYLNEQMQAIQKELGEKDDYQAEIQDLEEQLKKKRMSKEAIDRVYQRIQKL